MAEVITPREDRKNSTTKTADMGITAERTDMVTSTSKDKATGAEPTGGKCQSENGRARGNHKGTQPTLNVPNTDIISVESMYSTKKVGWYNSPCPGTK